MQKLTTCEMNKCQSQPKVSAVSRSMSPMPPAAAAAIVIIKYNSCAQVIAPVRESKWLVRQKVERVEHDRLGERDRENAVHEHLSERAGIAADGRCHSETGQTDADANAHRGEADVN